MITTILSDFSRVILMPKDSNYKGTLNGLYKNLQEINSFNFFDYFKFNEEILDLYMELKNKYSINIFTTGYIQNADEVKKRIKGIFENIFSADELELNKKDVFSYLFIAKKLNKPITQILYIDDNLENIKAAENAGMTTQHFFQNQTVIERLRSYL